MSLKDKILTSIAQFEDIYPEWEDIKITYKNEDKISIVDRKNDMNTYSYSESIEPLSDFKSVLKKNNLMISPINNMLSNSKSIKVKTYEYVFEPEYEILADKLERTLGNVISNLTITKNYKDGKPFVRFAYVSNMTSGEKSQIRKKVEQAVNEFLENQI
jgi:hypothetical protein